MDLLEILKQRKISKMQLALNARITPSDLYQALNGKKPFFPAWKKRIADFLDVDIEELFKEV